MSSPSGGAGDAASTSGGGQGGSDGGQSAVEMVECGRPDDPRARAPELLWLDVMGFGRAWPSREAEQWDGSWVPSAAGAAGAPSTLEDERPCTLQDGDGGTLAFTCSGWATIELKDAVAGEYRLTYPDGTEGSFLEPAARIPVEEAFVELRGGTSSNPDTPDEDYAFFSGRTRADSPIWIYEYKWSLEEMEGFFGVAVTREVNCSAGIVSGLVLGTEPPRRIVSGEPSRVETPSGVYDVAYRYISYSDWTDDILIATLVAEN